MKTFKPFSIGPLSKTRIFWPAYPPLNFWQLLLLGTSVLRELCLQPLASPTKGCSQKPIIRADCLNSNIQDMQKPFN